MSWVVYRVALDPAYAERIPYNVAIVELAEGPRLISNIVGVSDYDALRIELRLELEIDDVTFLPLFRVAGLAGKRE